MTTSSYMVIFQGRILSGFTEKQVKLNLQQRFKLSAAQVEKLFLGREITLKRNLPRNQAMLIQQVLLNCGADSVVRRLTAESGLGVVGQKDPEPAIDAVAAVRRQHDKAAGSAVTPPNGATPTYPLYAPLYLAFFSGNFYKNIAQRWKVSRSFLYLLLLVVVTQLPLIGYYQFKLNNFITEYADLIPQIPELRLKDHTLTTDCKVPCVLKHAGEDVLIVDPAGTREDLTASDAKIMINSIGVLIKDKKGLIRENIFPSTLDIRIDRQVVEKWLPAAGWFWLLLIFTLIPASYLAFCLKALFYGWIGMYMAKRHLAEPTFEKVLVLTIVCLTPVAVLDTALKSVLDGTPLLVAFILTLFILNLAIRQHGRGEREVAAPEPLPRHGSITPAPAGAQQSTPRPAGTTGTLKFYVGKNHTYLVFVLISLALIPFLFLFNLAGGDQKTLFMLSVSTIVVFVLTIIITLINKKNSIATLDETALSLRQITIPWAKIHAVREKTTNLGIFRWRTLTISGSFKAPFTGNKLNLPLWLLDKPDELVAAVTQRIESVDEVPLRQRAAKLRLVQTEELQYRKMRFTSSGIATNRTNIAWRQVKALAGQANVIAGLGTLTVSYLDDAGKTNALIIPAECSPDYQSVVAFTIAQAMGAKVDPELLKLLETDVTEARSSYLLLGLVMSSLVILIMSIVVLESYKFPFLLRTGLIMGGMIVWALSLNQVVFAGTRGNNIPLQKKKFWAWSTFTMPIIIVLAALMVAPDSRHWLLGDVTAKMGSFETAENHYSQALALSNDYYLIKFDLGSLYMDRGEWAKAFEYLDPAIREHIGNWYPEAVLYVPETLMRQGRQDEADKWCAEVLEDPKTPGDVRQVLTNKLQEIRSGLI